MKKIILAIAAIAATVACATQYSRLGIITAAKQKGKWTALKAWIQAADLEDEFFASSYLSDTYPQFPQITNAIATAGIATTQEIEEILAASIDSAISDSLMNAKYSRDMQTQTGRANWHGKHETYIDTNNLVRVWKYEDGYVFTEPWQKPESVVERKMREARQRAEALVKAAQRSAVGKPKPVQDIIMKRAENEALIITNGIEKVTIDVKTGEVVKQEGEKK